MRTTFKTFIDANSAEDFIDLTAQFAEMKDMIDDAGLDPADPWVGIQFVGDDEVPITIPATNTQGKYRETGAILLHVVAAVVPSIGAADAILTRGEVLRDLLRGRRIDRIVIESVSPMNFEAGSTLQFEGGYVSGSFICSYQCDNQA